MFHYWQFNDEYYNPDIWKRGQLYDSQKTKELYSQNGLTKEFRHDAMLWYLDDWIETDLGYRYADRPIWIWVIHLTIIKLLLVILQKKIIKDIIDPM